MELVVATGNAGKLREIRHLLEGTGIVVKGLSDFSGISDIVEDGETFEANARKKAETVARITGLPTLADDSGLEVEALGGAPGVRSARYAGERATDVQNNAKLLKELEALPDLSRAGAFCCAMAFCPRPEECTVFFGRVEGVILDAPRGEGGFGYDPLFLVREYGKTMAELSLETKNRISHRGQALRQAITYIRTTFQG